VIVSGRKTAQHEDCLFGRERDGRMCRIAEKSAVIALDFIRTIGAAAGLVRGDATPFFQRPGKSAIDDNNCSHRRLLKKNM